MVDGGLIRLPWLLPWRRTEKRARRWSIPVLVLEFAGVVGGCSSRSLSLALATDLVIRLLVPPSVYEDASDDADGTSGDKGVDNLVSKVFCLSKNLPIAW